ncbi:Cytochrome P459 monooxygenase [Paramyrothecium foliicola]|nr:Cytochrome P459 monooxygenase [Paramyrothecium foliicola]
MVMASVDFPMSAAANGANVTTTVPEGIVAAALADIQQSPTRYVLSTVAVLLMTYLFKRSIPDVDAREPKLLLPWIPGIGHIIGMMWNQSSYYMWLRKRSGLPIATLPFLGGKVYTIWDPALVSTSLRQKTLTFEPFAVEFVQKMLGMDDRYYNIFRDTPERPSVVPEFFDALHWSVRGDHLHRMNAKALNYLSTRLEEVAGEKPIEMKNFYYYLREMITLATTTALLGDANPFLKNSSLSHHMWVWEAAIPSMMLIPYHSITNTEALQSREILQDALREYYETKSDLDDSAAAVTRARAAVLRKWGLPDHQIARFEASLVQLATSNTIPTTFWLLMNIYSRPEILESVRAEAAQMVERLAGSDVASINITKFDEECPLLVSCYRESMRLSNHALCVRKVAKDTVISDGKGGQYLLKEGGDVQIPAGVSHRLEDTWGIDAADFTADRFTNRQQKLLNQAQVEKAKRNAYMPFGGGKHLCPGRNFAFAEILGVTAAFVLAFDITTPEGGVVEVPEMAQPSIIAGALKPEKLGDDMPVVMRRREGWENTKFEFKVIGQVEE